MFNNAILALLYKKRNMSGDKEYQKQNEMIYSVSWGFNFALCTLIWKVANIHLQ